ncbi:cell wall elongation regulator TseB-like domain-containing protein [Bacillus sp. Marseille-P3661]|uniref:cell wall elongation regulator TseB-like domain-containing protein n=1 Tax=Bacillus sp. Marseille-P3661 TaxID=1936234 RepID=UPI000C82252D|nr:DUF5590 domain-containing protein [Bacillus sp. Marseille-P3661]
MKKWVLIVSVLLIVAIWQATTIYLNTTKYQENAEQKAIEFAKKNSNIDVITDVEYYHGSLAFHVVYGQTETNKDIIIWVPENKDGNILIKNASEGWTKEKVRQHVENQQTPKKIIDIRLGAEAMKDNRTEEIKITPIWEVTYIDQQNRYTYYFLKFIDGSFVKRYSLKQK